MTRFSIRHETIYAYARPVSFGQHRLILRPRDSHAIRVLSASLAFSPAGDTRWVYDAHHNCVCLLTPQGVSDHLTVTSELVIERFPAPLHAENPRSATPIIYDHSDRRTLEPFIMPETEDADGVLLDWLTWRGPLVGEPALDFLLRINRDIHGGFGYRRRDEEGVQAPDETVRLGSGACRDLAWLMVEALRRLGYAARFVSGYLYAPGASALRGAGATHAWCEVFLPDLGWMEFDPTNGLAESPDLIPVAVARTPAEASPLSGVILGDPGAVNLSIHVDVRADATIAEPA